MDVIYIYGRSGCGKSHLAYELAGPDAYDKPPSGDWFDGYHGQKTVILDEFKSWMTYTYLLKILDKWPLRVPIKNSFQPYKAEKVIITSTQLPEELYPNVTNKQELYRRIKTIYIWDERDQNFEEKNFQEFMHRNE